MKLKPETLADRLGILRAEIAELEKREKEIKTALIKCGWDEIEGRLFRVTVSHANFTTVDYGRMLEDYDIDLRPYSEQKERVTVRVTARI